MSTSSESQALNISDSQLAKLTNESLEIRMRALDQIEKRFMRCLRHEEQLNFKPLRFLRQLLGWFNFQPPTATERVLSLILELLRSNYGDGIVPRMSAKRLLEELTKIRQLLDEYPSERGVELVEDITSLVTKVPGKGTKVKVKGFSADDPLNDPYINWRDKLRLTPLDHEFAWTQPSDADRSVLKTFNDSLHVINEALLLHHLTNLNIKFMDYPAEYFLQSPDIFLMLNYIQKLHTGCVLQHINRVLLSFIKHLQQRHSVRHKMLSYSTRVEPPCNPPAMPNQLRCDKALTTLLYGTIKKVGAPTLENCERNWHCFELIVEVIKMMSQLGIRIPDYIVQRLGVMTPKLLIYLHSMEVATPGDVDSCVKDMMIPRLQSLILNGLLMNVISVNVAHNPRIDHSAARSLLQPVVSDDIYLSCFPTIVQELSQLCASLNSDGDALRKQMCCLKVAYSTALNQLVGQSKMQPLELLRNQHKICLVLNQMGSETLLRQLVDAIVKCTACYVQPQQQLEVRQEAECLLNTLFDLPNEQLRSQALRLLKQPVVDHFHAFMNHANYMTGCNNIELVRHHVLGLPMSSHLVRKLLVQGWKPQLPEATKLELQQWCIDYLIMVLGLAKLISNRDFGQLFEMLLPVMPLMICRAASHPQLEQVIWDLIDPDKRYVDRSVALRTNACYLFHPDAAVRKEAINRVAYVLMRQDVNNIYRTIMDQLTLDLIGHDLCVIQPPIEYAKLFDGQITQCVNRSLLALQRLLETPDLKPGIRKSTLVQLNVLLHNWQAVEAFTQNEGSHMLCLNALLDPLLRQRQPNAMDTEVLKPAASILLRVLFRSERFRMELKDSDDILMCLLRCLFIVPHEIQLRAELSCCIFQLLYQNHMLPTETELIMNVNLSPLMVPVDYREDHVVPPTAASEGIALQDHLLAKHFLHDKELSALHWRLYIAHRICKSPENMQLEAVQQLDMSQSLKLTPTDLALVQATLVHVQLQQQLVEANNASSHEYLQQIVASLQLFLVLLRGNVPKAQAEALWSLMHKYLRNSPANEMDLLLYFSLLELCHSCLRHRLPAVMTGLSTALETDPLHGFFAAMRDMNVNVHHLQLISNCLVQLLHHGDRSEVYDWHGSLFSELCRVSRTHFEQRRLQQVRCLLSVMRQLSARSLSMEDLALQAHYQHYVTMSNNLRTKNHTGAQWQRDCILIMCQLHAQAKNPEIVAVSTTHGLKVLRYLLGLCAHCDAEVRTLAWVTLANWLKSNDNNMASVLPEFRDFLPGGMASCCLATMLDNHEQILLREMAGRVFERLMPHIGNTVCLELLNKFAFMQQALASLVTLELSPHVAENSYGVKTSCEIIGCFVSIQIRMVQLEPSWCKTLCENAFFHALSDVMKVRASEQPYTTVYLELCAGQICKLYALVYQHNFEYLKRSICRDTVLLTSFYALANALLDQKIVPEQQVEQVLKLMLVFCKDENAYCVLYDHFTMNPELLMDIMIYGCSQMLMHRPVQRYTLTLFSLLLTKTQYAPQNENLLRELESFAEAVDIDDGAKEDTTNEESELMNILDSDSEEEISNRLKILYLKPPMRAVSQGNNLKKHSVAMAHTEITNAAVLLYRTIDHMFEAYFPLKTYNFLQGPSRNHLQLCELLGNLLKLSPPLVDNARNAKLLDRIIQLIESFLDDPNLGDSTVYVRRVGALKTREIINNLLLIFNMLMHWHSSPHSVITDPVMASRFVRVILRMWPWLSHSGVLKHMVLCLTTHLTEHSFEMCKQTSLVLSNQSHSLLQLMVRVADHETTKKETPMAKPSACCVLTTTPNSLVEAALRVMINCCACADGRLSLAKMRVLDMFDAIMPATNTSQSKVRQDALLCWLYFWEIYSRYETGNKVCHMAALMEAVRRSPPLSVKRMTCLRIMRNMCFANCNRTQLIQMQEFQCLLLSLLLQPVQISGGVDGCMNSYAEHYLVILCVWKLFGSKHRVLLRGSKMFRQARRLYDHLVEVEAENQQYPFSRETKEILTHLFEAVKEE